MRVVVFTKDENREINFPTRPGLEFKHIRFETNDLDELLLIASFRVVNFPTSIIIDNKGKLLLKIRGTISEEYLGKYI